MLEVDTPYDLEPYVGKALGTSDWLEIDQTRIDDFARVSGDDNWIHVDVERARRELPGGRTLAHGMLTLSLITYLGQGICRVRHRSRGINYGSNKVRFTAPVQCGARIRLHRTLERYEPFDGGVRLTYGNRIEIEGNERPAMVAETMSLMYVKETQA
ncbi:enoyl-CoA hydratase [Bordetella sp. H567]|uniref:MaoC family dehydratase n=1 Tax=Bordetella sp. H567 TaxID=1697043 RepID=UPI00081D314A|nr:MaoC family dehydratase [Bordetella sp. H567]AOB31158.1 enoyl-CoA hydratase [Bordetella sp. H567]